MVVDIGTIRYVDPICVPQDTMFLRPRVALVLFLTNSADYFKLSPTGRYDIARALEKWGGLHEVSRLLSLKVRHPNRQASLAKEKKVELLANDVNCETTSSKPFVAQDAKKWLMKLKDLDINWVE
ncbi:hypothetical protein KY285_022794 [Solanum tuberosum]|nr:hypothetical protein KY285_022794 [Solanum tuberosum]